MRRGQTRCGELKLQLPLAGLCPNCLIEGEADPIHRYALNGYRRGSGIGKDFFRVDFCNAVHRREEQTSVSRLPAGGLKPSVTFTVSQAICRSIVFCVKRGGMALGIRFQLPFRDARDAPVRAHPQIAVVGKELK